MSAREVLELARSQQRAEDAAAARKLEAAAWWADLRPPESIHGAASYTLAGIEHEEAIAGPASRPTNAGYGELISKSEALQDPEPAGVPDGLIRTTQARPSGQGHRMSARDPFDAVAAWRLTRRTISAARATSSP